MANRLFTIAILILLSPLTKAGEWSLGVGAIVSPSTYLDYDTSITPLPLISYQGERWYLQGPVGGFKFLDTKTDDSPFGYTLSAELGLGGGSFDPDKSPLLSALDSRRISVDGKLRFAATQRWGLVTLTAGTDVSGAHDGQQLGLQYGFPLFLSDNFRAFGAVGVDWRSAAWSRFYYGVSEAEGLRSGLDAFTPDAVLNPGMTVTLFYQLAERWTLQGIATRSWLDADLWDSPMVGDIQDDSLIVGLSYKL